jgi:hypothetical protein
MDRRRTELQIRAVMYRFEVGRRDALTVELFREKARALLDGLEGPARPHPDLAQELKEPNSRRGLAVRSPFQHVAQGLL